MLPNILVSISPNIAGGLWKILLIVYVEFAGKYP